MSTLRTGTAVLLLASLAIGACVSNPAPTPTAAAPAAPAARIVGAPIVALGGVDAPGFNVEDLTARLREAMVFSSGVDIVDEISVRNELAACVEMPCKDNEQVRFQSASLVGSATVSRVGGGVIGSLRILSGIKEVVRVNASGKDAAAVVVELGREGGKKLRESVLASMPTQAAPSEER